MQKRKSPVLLVTALVVLVLGVALYSTASLMNINLTNLFSGPTQEQQQAVAQSRRLSDEDRQSTLDDIRDQIGRSSVMSGGGTDLGASPGDETAEIPAYPSVEMMPVEASKPEYNESSTAAQWYVDESEQKKMSEELDRSRSGN